MLIYFSTQNFFNPQDILTKTYFLFFRVVLDAGDLKSQLEEMKSPSEYSEAGTLSDSQSADDVRATLLVVTTLF